jgi:hypothetical protein
MPFENPPSVDQNSEEKVKYMMRFPPADSLDG